MLLVTLGVLAVARINREVFPNGFAVAGAAVTRDGQALGDRLARHLGRDRVHGRLLAYTHRVLFAFQLQ